MMVVRPEGVVTRTMQDRIGSMFTGGRSKKPGKAE